MAEEQPKVPRKKRRSLSALVWYSLVDARHGEDEGVDGVARSVDLSPGGICIYTTDPFPVGTRLLLAISVPRHGELTAIGEVKYCTVVRDKYHKSGLQLLIIPPNKRALLRKLLGDVE